MTRDYAGTLDIFFVILREGGVSRGGGTGGFLVILGPPAKPWDDDLEMDRGPCELNRTVVRVPRHDARPR